MVCFHWRHALLAAPQGVVLVSGVCADRLAIGEPMADAFSVVNFFVVASVFSAAFPYLCKKQPL